MMIPMMNPADYSCDGYSTEMIIEWTIWVQDNISGTMTRIAVL